MKKYFAYFVFTFFLFFGTAGKIPSTFTICKRHDPDLPRCLAKAIEHTLPLLKEGIPSLGIPAIEPVQIDSITVGGGTGAFSVSQKQTNVKIYHVIDSRINKTELTIGSKDFKLAVYIYIKQFRLESDYELEGKALLLPISGKGKSVIDIDDLQMVVKAKGELYKKKRKTYAKLDDVKVDVSASRVRFNFENLFNGDERLGSEMNKLLNENWKDIFNDVKAGYEEALAGFFTNMFNAVFIRVPYDELFPV